jgi:hypothetical protein
MPIPVLRAALVVLHHLGGLLLRDLAALLHAAADHGVHSVSLCRETEIPAVRLAALRSLPSADSCGGSGTNPVSSAGPRHRGDRRRSSRSPRTLPPRPFSLTGAACRFAAAVSRCGHPRLIVRMRAWTPRPCSIVGSVARPDVSVRPCPVLPWAWLVRSTARPPSPSAPPSPEEAPVGESRTCERPTSRQRPLRRALSSV